MRGIPGLCDLGRLSGCRDGEGAHGATCAGVAVERGSSRVELQPLRVWLTPARQRAEQVVEGVVLHHDHHDVVKRKRLRDAAGRSRGVGQAVRRTHAAPSGKSRPPQSAARHPGQRRPGRTAVAQERATREQRVAEAALNVGRRDSPVSGGRGIVMRPHFPRRISERLRSCDDPREPCRARTTAWWCCAWDRSGSLRVLRGP